MPHTYRHTAGAFSVHTCQANQWQTSCPPKIRPWHCVRLGLLRPLEQRSAVLCRTLTFSASSNNSWRSSCTWWVSTLPWWTSSSSYASRPPLALGTVGFGRWLEQHLHSNKPKITCLPSLYLNGIMHLAQSFLMPIVVLLGPLVPI